MTDRTKAISKAVATGVLLIGAAAFGVSQMRRAGSDVEGRLKIWFYDESERRLYAAPRDTIPPDHGTGGVPDDGVKAIVVAPDGLQNDPTQRRIAYLETYTPELKKLLEGVRAAKAAGKRYDGTIPTNESDFFQKNTLVRRVSEAQWFEAGSAEGHQIMTEWRSWPGSDGLPLPCARPESAARTSRPLNRNPLDRQVNFDQSFGILHHALELLDVNVEPLGREFLCE